MSSDPNPDSQDFESDEYKNILQSHDKFQEHFLALDKAIESETDEEFDLAMDELGYESHEIELCGNQWCQKKKECFSIRIRCFQNFCNENFFEDLLSDSDLIFKKELDYCEDLPKSWRSQRTKEGQVICFCLDMEDACISKNTLGIPYTELSKQKDVQKFGRNLYFFAQKILCSHVHPEKEICEIQKFLNKNKIFSPETSMAFIADLNKIIK